MLEKTKGIKNIIEIEIWIKQRVYQYYDINIMLHDQNKNKTNFQLNRKKINWICVDGDHVDVLKLRYRKWNRR
jgi:hypothetical protein